MKYYPFLFLVTIFSCTENISSEEEVLNDSGTVKQSELEDTCSCNDLDIDSTGNHFLDAEIYTGICVQSYPETDLKYIEKSILNGRLHGKVTYYDKYGEIILEEIYEEGDQKRSGAVDALNCDCSELDKVEIPGSQGAMRYMLDDIPYTGICVKYYPESAQIYMEANYENGLPDGYTTYYNKDGSTLLMEKYDNGVQVKAIH
jgi:hypothetical protein